ncbi:HSF-type DNA-binding-domain-containing protein [Mycena epipterygia]|nr:HSF-type DNA-binding-domain-containing protein [Mycena epipterygia]
MPRETYAYLSGEDTGWTSNTTHSSPCCPCSLPHPLGTNLGVQYFPTQQQQQHKRIDPNLVVKRGGASQEHSMSDHKDSASHEDSMPSASEFVKKLYKMLEDETFQNFVSWGPQGDCFVVKDMNEFTQTALPRMFKHSNFTSFVRQLNKYDFHKVKNTYDNELSEHSWTFRHPEFRADRPDALKKIKRKAPKYTSAAGAPPSLPPTPSSSSVYPAPTAYPQSSDSLQAQLSSLKSQLSSLGAAHDDVLSHVRNLERSYQEVFAGMASFQRGILQQDGLLQKLIQYSVPENTGEMNQIHSNDNIDGGSHPVLFMRTQERPRMLNKRSPEMDVARATLVQMGEISRRADDRGRGSSAWGSSNMNNNSNTPSTSGANGRMSDLEEGQMLGQQGTASPQSESESEENEDEMVVPTSKMDMEERGLAAATAADAWSNTGGDAHAGPEVYTIGHLMPRGSSNFADAQGNRMFNETAFAGGKPGGNQEMAHSSGSAPYMQTLRVRRSTFVPRWAVPPRVLLVDDDVVTRELSSKFLQVFGCTFDVAVDGVGAVNKMNLEKYDLVLMDIFMPKLDGTPIISMTSSSRPSEIMTYYSSGMNDILPKPFTKQGLLDMLEKHLTHLTMIQQKMSTSMHIPRPLTGTPPLSDARFQSSIQSDTVSSPELMSYGLSSLDADNGWINVLAGMGLTDEQYNIILAAIVNGEDFSLSEKRPLDLSEEPDGREDKRSRVEVIE